MKQTIEIPDRIIDLGYGDGVKIYVKPNKIEFHFCCDGTGNWFELSKEELRELVK